MAKKQLKVSMIFGGAYHTFGTVLEEDEIPPSLRKAKYLLEPDDDSLGLSDTDDYIDMDETVVDAEEEPKPRRRTKGPA